MLALPFSRPAPPALKGQRVVLRLPGSSDYGQWASLRGESHAFLQPWEPRWAHDELERRAWRQRLKRYREEFAQGSGAAFFIFEAATGSLAGGISIGNIRYGVAQCGQIGYWMGERFAGLGLMRESLDLVTGFAFDTLRLHRLEAACIPDNERSIALLEKAGFRREGLLRSYLKINGVWQDHFLYALLSGEQSDRVERG